MNKHAQALGKIKTVKKANSSRKNGSAGEKPHFKKVEFFIRKYPSKLEDNEWKEKFTIGKTPTGRWATYNPDYYCPKTGYFIEVATSKPNISEQGWKWSKVLKDGLKLKVFWWEGEEITKNFLSRKVIHR